MLLVGSWSIWSLRVTKSKNDQNVLANYGRSGFRLAKPPKNSSQSFSIFSKLVPGLNFSGNTSFLFTTIWLVKIT